MAVRPFNIKLHAASHWRDGLQARLQRRRVHVVLPRSRSGGVGNTDGRMRGRGAFPALVEGGIGHEGVRGAPRRLLRVDAS